MNPKYHATLTETRKNMNLPYSLRMYWTTVHAKKNIFEKTLIEIDTSHLYASFGTFYVQIGQLFEAEWVFENCKKTVKSLFLKESDVDFEFFRKFKVSLCLDWLTNLDAKVPKEAKRCELPTSIRIFTKIFCCTWTVGCQIFIQYIRME